jgi:hypothetical protein
MKLIGKVRERVNMRITTVNFDGLWPEVETYGNLVRAKAYIGRNKIVDESHHLTQGKQASLSRDYRKSIRTLQ